MGEDQDHDDLCGDTEEDGELLSVVRGEFVSHEIGGESDELVHLGALLRAIEQKEGEGAVQPEEESNFLPLPLLQNDRHPQQCERGQRNDFVKLPSSKISSLPHEKDVSQQVEVHGAGRLGVPSIEDEEEGESDEGEVVKNEHRHFDLNTELNQTQRWMERTCFPLFWKFLVLAVFFVVSANEE